MFFPTRQLSLLYVGITLPLALKVAIVPTDGWAISSMADGRIRQTATGIRVDIMQGWVLRKKYYIGSAEGCRQCR